MREFLVEISLHDVEELTPAELDAMREAETVRAWELAEQGALIRLWRPDRPGWRNVGLWRARCEEELRAMIGTLPFAPYMDISCTALREHPNDPASRGAGTLR